MTMKNKIIAIVAATTMVAAAGAAQANPAMNGLASVDTATAVEKVGFFKKNGRFTTRGKATIGVGAAIVGGLIANEVVKSKQRKRAARNAQYNAHVDWCLSRYRSYNPNTNLYNSYRFGWTECRSPYGG